MEIKIGDEVVFTSQESHLRSPTVYPACGTVGTVLSVTSTGGYNVWVLWPEGSTVAPCRWWVKTNQITLLIPDYGEFEVSELPLDFCMRRWGMDDSWRNN